MGRYGAKIAFVVLICFISGRLCKVTFRAQGVQTAKYGLVAQLVSAPPCHGGGRGFKSRQGRGSLKVSGQIAQSVEHTPEKCGVASSILALATIMVLFI